MDGQKKEEEEEGGSRYAGRNFYEVLGVRPDAAIRDIKRAYRTLALKVHPDRNGNSRESTRDFQELSRIMEILGDPERRANYDSTGDTEESIGTTDARTVFRKVTRADIEAYSATYFDGAEEKQDVLDAYERFEGDLEKMLEWIPLSSADRLPVYERIITEANARAFPKWAARKDAAKTYVETYASEAKEAEELLKSAAAKYAKFLPPPNTKFLPPPNRKRRRPQTSDDDDNSEEKNGGEGASNMVPDGIGMLGGLAVGMRARELARQKAMVAAMESRYGGKRRRRLPTEEEFQKIQRRLDRNKRTKQK